MRLTWKAALSLVLALTIALVLHIGALSLGGSDYTWTTDDMTDFAAGTLDGVDIWSTAGSAQLDRRWTPNARVNDSPVDDSQGSVRLTFVPPAGGPPTQTLFLAVWSDERVQDHYPDIYFASSQTGGAIWSSDILVSGAHVSGRALEAPDIAYRAPDGTYWVVWQNEDDGNLHYATSSDQGASWSASSPVAPRAATQVNPRIATDTASGAVVVLWEDEAVDDGDVFATRYDGTWTIPFRISDAASGSEQGRPAAAVDAAGNVYAVWEDERDNDDGEIYFSSWPAGGSWSAAAWSASKRLSDSSMDWASDPDIVAAPDGSVYAAWVERVPTGPATYDFQVVVAHSADQGDAWERSVVYRLYDAAASLSGLSSPQLGVDDAGIVYVSWTDLPDQTAYAEADVMVAVSPDGGAHWTSPQTVNAQQTVAGDVPSALSVSLAGEVVAAWEDYREPTGRQIYAAGYPALRYMPRGVYTSPTFDAGGLATWGTISWTATTPVGTQLEVATCAPESSSDVCTTWTTHASSGAALTHVPGRYLRFRATFFSQAPGLTTPVLEAVHVDYRQSLIYLPLVTRP